jgi:DNA-binding CsgD family transcriptional regulator
VKTHLERIFEKLSANDRAQAVAIAIRTGIVH